MNKNVYNISILTGVAMISAGVSLYSLPAGLITCGALILSLTVYSVERLRGG